MLYAGNARRVAGYKTGSILYPRPHQKLHRFSKLSQRILLPLSVHGEGVKYWLAAGTARPACVSRACVAATGCAQQTFTPFFQLALDVTAAHRIVDLVGQTIRRHIQL